MARNDDVTPSAVREIYDLVRTQLFQEAVDCVEIVMSLNNVEKQMQLITRWIQEDGHDVNYLQKDYLFSGSVMIEFRRYD